MRVNNSSDFDLDLFLNNYIILSHFATAGLHISDNSFFNSFHNDFRHFLKNLTIPPFKFELNPNLSEILSIKRELDREFNIDLYTSDFIKYAQKGLFSFDRTFIEDSSDIHFHLVAYPILNSNYNDLMNQIYGFNFYFDIDLCNRYITEMVNDEFRKSFTMEF